MPDPITDDKKIVDGDGAAGDNGADKGTPDPKDGVDKDKSVPLATFLDMKNTAKRLEADIDKMKAEQKKTVDDKIIADGELQKVIDGKVTELSDMKKELDSVTTKANEMTEFKALKVEAAKKALGDKWDEGYATLSLIALDKLVTSMIGVKASINADSGADGDKVKVELTADQKIEAKAMYAHLPEAKAFEYHTHNLIKTGKIKKDK